ncbi:hypothetical protein BB559_004067 [Furculomyces boomerangus]|uniref:Charged multivesicular body protein 6 n=2 Tax=Harpellales TaxID=61421 RepID=A0A2T9YGX2_9FUNG|nr:hypothetical protein BB559_004067 [Furculomyces boomerangus]PVZ98700.1 hypothetical protein BB558_005293 [Smittium angustum]
MGLNSSKQRITDQDKAILDIKVQRDKIQKYQIQIENVSKREQEIAQICIAKGDKKKALLALRKKKYQQELLTQTNEQLLNLQKLMQTIEFSLIQKDVLFGLRQGNSVLQKLNKEMNIEDVENLLSETRDAIEYQNEISALLETNLSAEAEESVIKEYQELEQMMADKLVLEQLPSIPVNKIPQISIPQQVENEQDQPAEEQTEQNSPVPLPA